MTTRYERARETNRPTETQRKIIQLLSHDDELFALTDDGNVFILIDGDQKHNEPAEWEFIVESPFL